MVSRIMLGNIAVDVVLKDIKNVYLSVYPPNGRVRIAAPEHMNLNTVRAFAVSKLAWIKKHQKKVLLQERETFREYLDRESHYVWGRRYLLRITEVHGAPEVELTAGNMLLRVRPGSSAETREAVVYQWYREQLKAAIPELLAKWEAHHGCKSRAGFCTKNENQVGELQYRQTQHSSQYRIGQKASHSP